MARSQHSALDRPTPPSGVHKPVDLDGLTDDPVMHDEGIVLAIRLRPQDPAAASRLVKLLVGHALPVSGPRPAKFVWGVPAVVCLDGDDEHPHLLHTRYSVGHDVWSIRADHILCQPRPARYLSSGVAHCPVGRISPCWDLVGCSSLGGTA